MQPAQIAACAGLLLGLALPASALIARLDDSTSPRAQVSTDFRNAQPIDGTSFNLPLGRIEYRLATSPYIGRRARIFYVIPAGIAGLRSPAGLQVQWRGNGALASGIGRPGERVPVWNGTVAAAWMIESFDLTLRIDPRELRLPSGASLNFESIFEIETLP
jgi:hypothetical protein